MSQGSRRAQDDVRQDFEPSSKQASGKTGGRKAGAGGTADHSDILEDDFAELMTSMKGKSDEVTNRSSLDVPSSALAELAAEGSLDESTAATLGTAASLGNVASDLSQQLASITEEMNKIREELYGDSGIGGIAKELASLKAGSLSGLLEGSQDSLDNLNDLVRSTGAERPTSRKSTPGNSAASTRSEASRQRGSSSASEEATRQRRPAASNDSTGNSRLASEKKKEEIQRSKEELRRKIQRNEKKPSVSIPDKLMLLFLVLVLLYIGSPFFRTAVKKAFTSWVGGREDEEEEEIFDY